MNAIKQAHYNLGIAYLNDAQYSKAIHEFQTAITLDADFMDAHCGLARAYVESGELDKAEMSATAALQFDVNYPPALALLDSIKQTYYNKGITYLNSERYGEAVAILQKAVTLDADFMDAHYYLGRAYIGLQAYHKAVDSLQSAVTLDANLEDAHYYLGYAYVEQGQYDKAIQHLERAIALNPNLKHAHYNLARAYREQGDLEAATNAATETLRLDANYEPVHELVDRLKQAHYNRGITYMNDERYSDAVAAFQDAITLDSMKDSPRQVGFKRTSTHYNLGVAYLKMETYTRAVDALQKTIALDRTYKAAHHALALAYFGQLELGKARDAARDALKVDANYQPARSLLEAIDPSFVRLEAPSFTSPETQVVTPPRPEGTSNPQPAAKPTKEGHHELGIAYLNAKKHTEAIAEFNKAIALDPDFAAAHSSLGSVYLELGQLDQAENAAKKALGVDANFQSAHQLLDDIKQERPVPLLSQTDEASAPDTAKAKQDLKRGLVFLNNKLIQVINFARNRERNQRIRKKVLAYTAILGVIAMGIFGAIKFDILPWPLPAPLDPDISIAETSLEEPSGNGFLDAGETARLKLIIRNSGGTARNIEVRLQPPSLAGLRYKKPGQISKISKNSEETIRISMTADKNVKGRNQALQIQVFGKIGLFGKKEPLMTEEFSFKIIPSLPDPVQPRRR